MKREPASIVCVLIGLLIMTPSGPLAAVEAPETPLQPLARLIGGNWTMDTPDLKGRVIYEWGVNRRLVKSKTYVLGEKGETLRYESVFWWHPQRKRLISQSFGAGGEVFEGTIEVKDGALEFEFTAYSTDNMTDYRQTIRLLDDDRYTWTLSRKAPGGWEKIRDTVFRRKKAEK